MTNPLEHNVHGEVLCDFTDLPEDYCSHCAGLPWDSEFDWDE